MENKWISVKDITRLPKKEQIVIIYFTNKAGSHVSYSYWNGENFINMCEECNYEEIHPYSCPITHWMPLPGPPTDDEPT